jgi:hypothetical protein
MNFGGQFQWPPAAPGDFHCEIGPLLRHHAAEKKQVRARYALKFEFRERQTVMDRADPVRARHRPALSVGNRH